MVLCGGSFEASLILIDELWEDTLDHFAPNGFIAAFPCRDILAFCDAESAAGIEQLRQIITRAEEGDHQITPVPYYRSGVNVAILRRLTPVIFNTPGRK